MLCSTRPVFYSVLTHPVCLRALWTFFFQVTPHRCLAQQQRPLLRSLRRLSTSSSRTPVLTWRSSSRTLLSSRLGRLSATCRPQLRPALPQLRSPLLHSGCTLGVGHRGFLQLHQHLRPLLLVQLRLLWRPLHRRLLRRLHRWLQSVGLCRGLRQAPCGLLSATASLHHHHLQRLRLRWLSPLLPSPRSRGTT